MDGCDGDGTKRFQAMCLIMSAGSDRYSGIWNDLKNSTLLGKEKYSKPPTAAYNVMCRYKKPAPPHEVHAPHEAVTLVQIGDTDQNQTTPGNYGRSFTEITCYRCQETGHYTRNCLSSTANTRTGTKSLQNGLIMTQTTKEAPPNIIINPNWILLDTCSTISSIRNKILVQDIQPCDVGE